MTSLPLARVKSPVWERMILMRGSALMISSKPFEKDFVEDKIAKTSAFFNIENGAELVDEISRTLLPYNTEKQPIHLLPKNGEKFRLENSENQILSAFINQPNTKYILSFPREI